MLAKQLSAQEWRTLRLMRRLKPHQSELDHRVWLSKHRAEQADQEFSRLQEQAFEKYMPGSGGAAAQRTPQFSVGGQNRGLVRQHSAPLYPGEYRAHQEDAQSLTVGNLRNMLVHSARKNERIADKNSLLLKIPTLDYEKLEELVSNLFPLMEREESSALLKKVIDAVQLNDEDRPHQKVVETVTAEMLQLQGYPQTYAAMVLAIGRRQNSKAFKVQEARNRFLKDLDFTWKDLQTVRRRVAQMGERHLGSQPDVVDLMYSMYEEFINTPKGEKDEARKPVPIGERVVNDEEVQYAFGTGYHAAASAVARIRENANGNGKMSVNGAVPIAHFSGKVSNVEMLLQPFDEADLNVFDFDVDVEVFGVYGDREARAARVAISNALVHLLPHTKPFLDAATFLYPVLGNPGKKPLPMAGTIMGRSYKWTKRGNPNKLF